VFAEIRRVLKPQGLLIFSVPNLAALSNRMRAALGRPFLKPVYAVFREERGERQGGEAPQPRGLGHVRLYTMSETIDLVTHYGFEVLEARRVSGGGEEATRGGLLRRLLYPFYRAACRLVPNAQAINLLLCRKTEKNPS
jgi:SAM-dependent methyltransferase